MLPHTWPLLSSCFCRYMASRFTFSSTPITPAWPSLPFDGLQSAFGGVFGGNSVAFVLASSDLFLWAGAAGAGRWLALSSLGAVVPVTPGSAASRASFNGARPLLPHCVFVTLCPGTDGIILAGPDGLHFVSCDWAAVQPSKCTVDHIIALPFGSVQSVAADGSIILVAPSRGGLFALDLSTDTYVPACHSIARCCIRFTSNAMTFVNWRVTTSQSFCGALLQSLRWHQGRRLRRPASVRAVSLPPMTNCNIMEPGTRSRCAQFMPAPASLQAPSPSIARRLLHSL